jgi:hypothetical protein
MASALLIVPLVAALVAVAYVGLGHALSTFTRSHFTILEELKSAGQPRASEKKLRGRVVICGGSIGGLLSARVCSDHFDEVVIIDPDNDTLLANLDDERMLHPTATEDKPGMKPISRARVMQYNAFHAAQPIWFAGLQQMFPDLEEELKVFNAP